MDLLVHSVDADAWTGGDVAQVARLLLRLTGDDWNITLVQEAAGPPEHQRVLDIVKVERVALLSGGLDSFCGLLLDEPGDCPSLYVGHWGNTAVKGSQNSVARWYRDQHGQQPPYEQVFLTQSRRTKDATTRTRSLLFLALAAAHAVTFGAAVVEVPENGYTSLNPPLSPARAGALSTRSTHPWTFNLFNDLMDALGVAVRIENPYQSLTKGQLVARAASTDASAAGMASTMSCSKMDGRLYRLGSTHLNCGLCFSCLVRRASMAAAGVADRTPYLATTLQGEALKQLHERRRADVEDVLWALAREVTEFDLEGPFPSGFDLAAAVRTCNLALDELRALPQHVWP